jgi:hypothetical protein
MPGGPFCIENDWKCPPRCFRQNLRKEYFRFLPFSQEGLQRQNAFFRHSSSREIKNDFSAEDAQSASGGHFKSSEPGGLFATFCKKIRLQSRENMVK